MRSSHTSANLAAEIKEIYTKFHLGEKIILVVSDNASNITGAITNELRLKHFGCYAHNINLILQDGLKLAQKLIERVKAIVAHFKRSTSARHKLNTVQKNMGMEPKKTSSRSCHKVD